MGSNSRGKDGEGTSGINRVDDDDDDDNSYEYLQELNFVPYETLVQNNMNTNGFVAPFVMQQVPVIVMQRPGMMTQPQPPQALMQNRYVETVIHEKLKSVRITWIHGGTNVSIAGSWNNWETVEALLRVGQHFVIVKTLPISIYYYRFIVDGQWTHAPEFPSNLDDSGYVYNILDLQDYIPQRLQKSEEPQSPPSSYDNIFLNEDEFNKPPPELPPQIPVTITQEEASTSNIDQVPSSTHVDLNHLYINKSDGDQFVTLRSTHRFQHKFVTTILYKSLQRER